MLSIIRRLCIEQKINWILPVNFFYFIDQIIGGFGKIAILPPHGDNLALGKLLHERIKTHLVLATESLNSGWNQCYADTRSYHGNLSLQTFDNSGCMNVKFMLKAKIF